MGFDDIVRSLVGLANEITADLQSQITIHPWTGSNDNAGPIYGTPYTISAVVEEHDRLVRLPSGQEIRQRAEIMIIQPIAANGATGRIEPIDTRDKIILQSGYTGPIRDVMGPTDPSTGNPYVYTVILG